MTIIRKSLKTSRQGDLLIRTAENGNAGGQAGNEGLDTQRAIEREQRTRPAPRDRGSSGHLAIRSRRVA